MLEEVEAVVAMISRYSSEGVGDEEVGNGAGLTILLD